MFCMNCGTELKDDAAFCKNCGSPQPQAEPAALAGEPAEAASAASAAEVPEAASAVGASGAVGAASAAETLEAPQPQSQPERKKLTPPVIAGIVVGAVVVVAAIVVAVMLFGPGRSLFSSDSNGAAGAGGGAAASGAAGGGDAQVQGQAQEALPEDYEGIVGKAKDVKSGTMSLVSADVSDYPNVKLYFTFEGDGGNPIELVSPTAGVKEKIAGGDEIERTVRSIERLEGNQGLSIDIVADKSGSMEYDLPNMQRIMTDFVDSLDYDTGDMAEIITFDTYTMYMCTYTNDAKRLDEGISNMSAYGETALYDALVTGVNRAASRPGARCVIGFTDGADNRSVYTYQEAIDLAKSKEVPIYLIGTSGADESTLRSICSQTGGKYWSISSVSDMKDVLDEIYRYQKDMYCVEYTSDEKADAYAARTITCALTDANVGNVVENQTFTAVKTLESQKHDKRYEVIAGDVSWTEANDLCLERGGHLATITSQEEMDELVKLADESGLRYLWIGGYTSVDGSKAYGHWITGEPFSYTAWYEGEPSRNDHDGAAEFYLMMWDVKDDGTWTWNDQRNDVVRDSGLSYFTGKIGYIIEYED